MKSDKNKNDFLAILSAMSKDDLNQLIKQKGKKPKLVRPVIRLTRE